MKNCGKRFHSEVGKFRFLNELIKVVSPKVRLHVSFCVLVYIHIYSYKLVCVSMCKSLLFLSLNSLFSTWAHGHQSQ